MIMKKEKNVTLSQNINIKNLVKFMCYVIFLQFKKLQITTMVPDSMTVLTARPLKYCRLFLYECYSVNLNTLSYEKISAIMGVMTISCVEKLLQLFKGTVLNQTKISS